MTRGWRRWGGGILALAMMAALAVPGRAEAQGTAGLGIHDVIESVEVVNGGLVARTTQGQVIPLNLGAQRRPGQPCPILNLELGPVELNLLGLVVETSKICLDITARPGGGKLLGNLLCSVARLLDRGVPLSQILAGLTATEVNQLTDAIREVLNAALNQLNNAVVTAVQQGQNGCTILDLALGPLELDVLGLVVELDDCANGPVTVTITAVPGTGNLLGNLLCGVLAGITPGTTLQQLLQQVLTAILGSL
jgi:hypothetical protein